jgi:hypothetical protein
MVLLKEVWMWHIPDETLFLTFFFFFTAMKILRLLASDQTL